MPSLSSISMAVSPIAKKSVNSLPLPLPLPRLDEHSTDDSGPVTPLPLNELALNELAIVVELSLANVADELPRFLPVLPRGKGFSFANRSDLNCSVTQSNLSGCTSFSNLTSDPGYESGISFACRNQGILMLLFYLHLPSF